MDPVKFQILIESAKEHFLFGNYDACNKTLDALIDATPGNWKMKLNRVMVGYLVTSDDNLDLIQDQLASLYSQMTVDNSESDDHSIFFYNQAIVCLRQKKYADAESIVNKIFHLASRMERGLGMKVCSLLLDLNIYLGNFKKAISNLFIIEKQYHLVNPLPVLDEVEDCLPNVQLNFEQFRSLMLEYKARAYLGLGDHESCVEVLDLLVTPTRFTFRTALLMSKLCVAMGNYQDALDVGYKYMQRVDEFEDLPLQKKMVLYNNMAVISRKLNKSHLSSFFMDKSLKMFHEGSNNAPSNSIAATRYFTFPVYANLMYNRGVTLLFRAQPAKAFDCFMEAAHKMFRSPIFWLRLAECCIFNCKPQNSEAFDLAGRAQNIVYKHTEDSTITINSKMFQNSDYDSAPRSYAFPEPTMDFATICAKNALLIQPKILSRVRLAILAANAYIRLSIGDHVVALKHAGTLLDEATILQSPLYKYLARLYISEAYLYLDQINKAIRILDPNIHKDPGCDPMQEQTDTYFLPDFQNAGNTVLLYNIAVALAMRKDYKNAWELLKHCWISRGPEAQVPVHVLSLAIYISLIRGRVETSKAIIKRYCPHIFDN